MLPKPNGNGANHLFALNSLRNNACATALRNVQGMAMANSGGLLGLTSQLVQAMASLSARGAADTSADRACRCRDVTIAGSDDTAARMTAARR